MIINIQIRRGFDQDIMQSYASIIDQQGKKVVHWIYFLDWYDAKIISHWQETKTNAVDVKTMMHTEI